ncbi:MULTISPECIES: hypothetical protein [Streptomyces]|uniref:Uncharacterized protein n=1 Tax=Streptomyces evansiae TaxID=3075535 RepID=A0ABU2R7Q2_9ACTN|nr:MULTISPECIES: hypothetical protein [unclassified Streptomyces]MDT0412645.1 hypothetical protein [Streptomyces sp. DSM 41979]MYQ60216.1 hypothetical protein [Streptomyces sp. SID4926]
MTDELLRLAQERRATYRDLALGGPARPPTPLRRALIRQSARLLDGPPTTARRALLCRPPAPASPPSRGNG